MLINFGFKLEFTLPKFGKTVKKKNKSSFKVTLTKAGESRVQTAKIVYYNTDIPSIREAMDAVDNIPTVLKEEASKQVAFDLKKVIETKAPGAEVTIE